MVHHVTIPCSESLLVSSSEGTVVAKVPGMSALATLLLLLRVVLKLPTYLVSFDVLLPVCVSALLEIGNYLAYGCLFSGPPGHMSLHLLHHPLCCTRLDMVVSVQCSSCLLCVLYGVDQVC